MKINQLKLVDYRGFKEASFDFSDNINLFVGINGSGKSSVLDSMAAMLTRLVKQVDHVDASGNGIRREDIRNGSDVCFINIKLKHKGKDYTWFLTEPDFGKGREEPSYGELSMLASTLRNLYRSESRLPIIAYYPIRRSVNRVVPLYRRNNISSEDVYGNSFAASVDYKELFEWFRNQDDILNEEARSRSIWMRENKHWIRRYVLGILTTLDEINTKVFSSVEIDYFGMDDSEFIEHPDIFFIKLSHVLDAHGGEFFKKLELPNYVGRLGIMFHKIGLLSEKYKDGALENGKDLFDAINEIHDPLKRMDLISGSIKKFKKEQDFIHRVSSLVIRLSFWWISDKSRQQLDHLLDKNRFMATENDLFSGEHERFIDALRSIVDEDIELRKQTQRNDGKELQFVKDAIEKFIPEYSNLRVRRQPHPRMELTKGSETLDIEQLSDGEKNIIALIGDIARRLVIANPNSDAPLESEGIILIDEIDLHLHPKWQRSILPSLQIIFPNCQFFISTHSPQVISSVKPKDIFVLEYINGKIESFKPDESYGMSIDRVVELVMQDYSRPDNVREKLENLYILIERKRLDEANRLLDALKVDMPTDPEVIRAEIIIRTMEKKDEAHKQEA